MGPENLVTEMKGVIEEVLKSYPEKTAKNRAKHLGVGTPSDETKTCAGVQSNKNHTGRHESKRLRIRRL